MVGFRVVYSPQYTVQPPLGIGLSSLSQLYLTSRRFICCNLAHNKKALLRWRSSGVCFTKPICYSMYAPLLLLRYSWNPPPYQISRCSMLMMNYSTKIAFIFRELLPRHQCFVSLSDTFNWFKDFHIWDAPQILKLDCDCLGH